MAFRIVQNSGNSSEEQEHDSSMEMLTSPPPVSSILRRRLEFTSPGQDEKLTTKTKQLGLLRRNEREKNNNNNNNINNNNNENKEKTKTVPNGGSVSPPYRKVRALRLFDTPATPKTILQKSANHLSSTSATKNFQTNGRVECQAAARLFKPAGRDVLPLHVHVRQKPQKPQKQQQQQQPVANVNPFTPDSLMAHNKKRCRIQFGLENGNHNHSFHSYGCGSNNKVTEDSPETRDHDELETHSAPKRLALQDTNISRYQKEFIEISLIGIGEFGLVYKCLNRLDGCIYAIKKSIKPVAGSSFEKRALNEVWAHAVLGKHDNVVRYYSAWAEDNHMLIQNEYCNGGSLQSVIQKRCLKEDELRNLLLHVAEGLRYIHTNDLVHMDLKAGNIFITKDMPHKHNIKSTMQDDEEKEVGEGDGDGDNDDDDDMNEIYDELSSAECIITYKIGDLGHVTSLNDPNVEEGDCRYLPNEILQEDYSRLDKADIFSLGITLYEAASGGPLPKNGPEWHELRNGNMPNISSLSKDFNDLIKLMTHPDPDKRPSSTTIFNHSILISMESKSKSQLSQELAIEKQKNEILLKKLREAKKVIKHYENKERYRALLSPKLMSDQRLLRSYTRNKRINLCASGVGVGVGVGAKINQIRDCNKNLVNY